VIKVAYLIDILYSDRGGTERQLVGTLKRLDRSVVEPTLIVLRPSPWLAEASLPCPVHVLNYTGFFSWRFPGVLLELARLFFRNDFDIVQTFFEDSVFLGYMGRLFSRRRPLLLVSRRDIGLGSGELWYHRLFRRVSPYIYRHVDGVMVNGHKIKEFVMDYAKVDASKIKVIHNGIEYPPTPRPAPALFAEHPARVWIAFAANFNPGKRHDVFLKAFARLNPEAKGIRAALLGEGEEEKDLKSLAKDLGVADRVHFLGSIKDVPAYLQHSHIGVLCSEKEGFSNAIMEYMCSGLPVVATNVGGNVELVTKDTGLLVPVGDHKALGDALEQLAEDPAARQRLGDAARQQVEGRFSWQITVGQLQHHYQRLLEKSRNGHHR